MRRREAEPTDAPLRLQRYRAEEWPEGPQAWYDAREEFRLQGGRLPPFTGGPDVPFDPYRVPV